MIVREQEMLTVVAQPETVISLEPLMRCYHPERGVGETIRRSIHEHGASGASDGVEGADEIERAKELCQGDCRFQGVVTIAACVAKPHRCARSARLDAYAGMGG